jgi:hypothetical protein
VFSWGGDVGGESFTVVAFNNAGHAVHTTAVDFRVSLFKKLRECTLRREMLGQQFWKA